MFEFEKIILRQQLKEILKTTNCHVVTKCKCKYTFNGILSTFFNLSEAKNNVKCTLVKNKRCRIYWETLMCRLISFFCLNIYSLKIN